MRKSTILLCAIASSCLLTAFDINTHFPINKEKLGERLYHDKSLSKDGKQSCATCHDVHRGFIDPRVNLTSADSQTPGAVSLGQDQLSLGDRNTPSAAYAAFVPKFYFDETDKIYKGGLFLDGRVNTLAEQAQKPFTNPVEMQATKQSVVDQVKKNYEKAMKKIYGEHIFDNTEQAFAAIADSIAAFEKTPQFSPFDSKFDRVLRGEARFTASEQRGLVLFKDEKKGNCAACHPVPERHSSKENSLFTDFSYDNLGVPANIVARARNGKAAGYVDAGLLDNPAVTDPSLKGAFRVPSLRNIAVTGPYMHNGVFKNLHTVVQFYNTRDVVGAINPETHAPWQAAEIDTTKNTEELGNLKLTDAEVDDIVAFMKTLTDRKFEHLIK